MKDEPNEMENAEIRDTLEGRVLALLLDELEPAEAETLKARLAEDQDLREHYEHMERALDLVSEAARGRAALEGEDLRLDPARRKTVESLWAGQEVEEEQGEEADKLTPFDSLEEEEAVGQNERKAGGLVRFLPMAAAAAVVVGSGGIIIDSLFQQAFHDDEIAYSTRNATRTTSAGEEGEGALPKVVPMQRQKALADSSNAPVVVDQLKTLAELSVKEEKLLELGSRLSEAANESGTRALEQKLASRDDDLEIRKLEPGLFDGDVRGRAAASGEDGRNSGRITLDEGASANLGRKRKDSETRGVNENPADVAGVPGHRDLADELDGDSKGLGVETLGPGYLEGRIDERLQALEEKRKPVGGLRSVLEAQQVDTLAASASGGATGAGGGVKVPSRSTDPRQGQSLPGNYANKKETAPKLRYDSSGGIPANNLYADAFGESAADLGKDGGRGYETGLAGNGRVNPPGPDLPASEVTGEALRSQDGYFNFEQAKSGERKNLRWNQFKGDDAGRDKTVPSTGVAKQGIVWKETEDGKKTGGDFGGGGGFEKNWRSSSGKLPRVEEYGYGLSKTQGAGTAAVAGQNGAEMKDLLPFAGFGLDTSDVRPSGEKDGNGNVAKGKEGGDVGDFAFTHKDKLARREKPGEVLFGDSDGDGTSVLGNSESLRKEELKRLEKRADLLLPKAPSTATTIALANPDPADPFSPPLPPVDALPAPGGSAPPRSAPDPVFLTTTPALSELPTNRPAQPGVTAGSGSAPALQPSTPKPLVNLRTASELERDADAPDTPTEGELERKGRGLDMEDARIARESTKREVGELADVSRPDATRTSGTNVLVVNGTARVKGDELHARDELLEELDVAQKEVRGNEGVAKYDDETEDSSPEPKPEPASEPEEPEVFAETDPEPDPVEEASAEGEEEEGESDKQTKGPDAPDYGTVPAPVAAEPKPEVMTAEEPFSTFSLNISDVSFRLAEAALDQGQWPGRATLRSEEFVNAFDYHDPFPAEGDRLSFHWERSRHPFAHGRDLLRFSVRAAATGRENGTPLKLVILLDNSGSMERSDRVALTQKALNGLAEQLTARDRVSLVTFARRPRLRVDNLPGDRFAEVVAKVGEIVPEGGTNLEAALDLAYATARKRYLSGGGNRVILLTDGAANLGEVAPLSLKGKVDEQRRRGIALDCFGVGWDGYDDHMLETLSRNGDGRYAFLNDLKTVNDVFGRNLAGALRPAASDLKVQIEFNPERVELYRQVGFEKHQLKKEYFRDNSIDAAEISAAEAGNALYVLKVKPNGKGDLGVFRVRYKEPETGVYKEHEWKLAYRRDVPVFAGASPAMRLAGRAATFAEWLAESPYGAGFVPAEAEADLRTLRKDFPPEAPVERLRQMVSRARSITR